MNANLDDLLREGMTRFTADLHAPADLADRARRRRRDRLVLRTVAASAAAAIAITAVAVATANVRTSRPPDSTGPVELADVEYVRLTGSAPIYAQQIWDYRGVSRELFTSSTGRVLEDDRADVYRYSSHRFAVIRTIVEVSSKTWGRARLGPFSVKARVAPTCAQPELGWPDSPVSLPRWIRNLHKAMDCGDFTIAGTARIEGVEAIKLVATKRAAAEGGVKTIWVTKADDVPLRETGGSAGFWWRADMSWLRPTTANVALLDVPIPPGFRQVGIHDFPNALSPPVSSCHNGNNGTNCTIVAYSPY